MLLSPAMPARITRITIMAVLGLLCTYAMGYYTVGTMVVYCSLIFLYSNSLREAKALLKKRLLIQIIAIPITTAVIFSLAAIPGFPARIRLPLGVCICVPILLTINYRFKLGFSEVSQLVAAAILTSTYEGNHTYFILRFTFTQLGILVSFFFYMYIFPLRHDRAFEKALPIFREKLRGMAGPFFQRESGLTRADYAACAAARQEVEKHLTVLADDADIKRQYRPYITRMPALLWERRAAAALLALLDRLEANWENEALSPDCRDYLVSEGAALWRRYDALCRVVDGDAAQPADYDIFWDDGMAACIHSATDLSLLALLSALRQEIAAFPGALQPVREAVHR